MSRRLQPSWYVSDSPISWLIDEKNYKPFTLLSWYCSATMPNNTTKLLCQLSMETDTLALVIVKILAQNN